MFGAMLPVLNVYSLYVGFKKVNKNFNVPNSKLNFPRELNENII